MKNLKIPDQHSIVNEVFKRIVKVASVRRAKIRLAATLEGQKYYITTIHTVLQV